MLRPLKFLLGATLCFVTVIVALLFIAVLSDMTWEATHAVSNKWGSGPTILD